MSNAISAVGKAILTAGLGAILGLQLADFQRDGELSERLSAIEYRIGIKQAAPEEKKAKADEKRRVKNPLDFLVLLSDTASKDTVQSSMPATSTLNFSGLSDSLKRERINKVIDALNNGGGYTFPVMADDYSINESFGIGNNYFEFGAKRAYNFHHGVDIYGFGKPVLAFRDGVVGCICRDINKIDFGNIIVINHGIIDGDTLMSYYLHVGGISSNLKVGDSVKTGQPIALTDCVGIPTDDYQRHIVPGSSLCKNKAHLHFELVYGDCSISPLPFFKKYAKHHLEDISGSRLALETGHEGMSKHLDPLSPDQMKGSHSLSVESMIPRIEAEAMYARGAKLYHDTSFDNKIAAYRVFDSLTKKYDSYDDPAICNLVFRARVSKANLSERWLQ
jgi:murein DD-endopeptidase MepM/ murein hydrolase activator NlpD